MNFKIQASPHIRIPNVNVSNMMINVLIASIPVVFMAIIQFRFHFVLALILSLVTVCGLEYIANRIMKRENTLNDFSGVVTAVIFALTIPAGIFSTDQYGSAGKAYLVGSFIIIVSAAFAIIIGKMVFGGLGRNIFNPAGLGRIFMLISFGALLSYFATDANLYVSSATPLGEVKSGLEVGTSDAILGVTSVYSIGDMFFGRVSGSFGEVNSLAIIVSALFLVIFKIADWRKIVVGLGTFAVLAGIYALRMNLGYEFILIQLFSGSILFGVVFMVTDPVTAPVTPPGRVFYAMAIGGLTFIIRIFGAYPEGMLFAILIMNMFTPAIDYYKFARPRFTRGWNITLAVTMVLFIAIILVGTK